MTATKGTIRPRRGALVIGLGILFLLVLLWEGSHIDRFGFPANESAAVGSLRTLYSANASYAKSQPQRGYPRKLSDLSMPSGSEGGEEITCGIDAALASGVRAGYRFTYTPSSSSGDEKMDTYEVSADPLEPGKSGKRHFFLNESGVIRMSKTGPAGPSSAPLQ
jgi:type IV pilus assembly protein PilA